MILYHFCCEHDMRGIRNKGICRGAVVTDRPILRKGKTVYQNVLNMGWQWLTLDGDRTRQSWATNHLIRIDRLEYRWTVEIPKDDECQLYDRDGMAWQIPTRERLFDGWAGSENWRVYHGNIPKRYLKKLERWNRDRQEWEEVA